MTDEDRELGMDRFISRRNFMHGASAAAGLAAMMGGAPLSAAAAAQAPYAPAQAGAYPPLRTGLRGFHPGAYEPVHDLVWGGRTPPDAESTGEIYDLVVVGGGLSGLASAYYYRKLAGPGARILILDNLEGVGGHAQRNEFEYEGRVLYANAGSAYLVTPSQWSREARSILDDLGVAKGDPRDSTDQNVYASRDMGGAVLFPGEVFGRDHLVRGSLTQPTAEFLAQTPLPAAQRADLDKLMNGRTDYLAGKTEDEKIDLLRGMSYRDYLLNVVGLSEESLNFVKGAWAMGLDTCSAWFAFFRHRPGFEGLGLSRPDKSPESEESRQDDYTLPGGNSDLARLIIRSLIPEALPAGDVFEIADKRMDYSVLDREANATRIRQSSIVYNVRHLGRAPRILEPDAREVQISYLNQGRALSVKAANVVMACMNNVIPHICTDVPDAQVGPLHMAVRAANISTNVLFRNWRAFEQARLRSVTSPYTFYGSMSLSSPRRFGPVTPSLSPEEPVIASFGTGGNSGILSNPVMVRALCGENAPEIGMPADDQYRIVRQGLLSAPLELFEREVRLLASKALAGTDFDPARDIVAVAVNRWGHGFATGTNELFDGPPEPGQPLPTVLARQKFGRIAIANTDAGGVSTVQTAFDQAWRAVNDLQSRAYGFYEQI